MALLQSRSLPARPSVQPSRLSRETSNLDSIIEDISQPAGFKENKAPTNFTGLIKSLSQNNAAAPFSRRATKAPAKPIRTFNDISRTAAAADAAQPDELAAACMLKGVLGQREFSMSSADSSATAAATSSQKSSQQSVSLAPPPAAQPARQKDTLPTSGTPPLDWSLKTQLRFSSKRPFAVCEEACLASAGCWTGSALGTGSAASPLDRYHQALQYFQHPDMRMDPSLIQALAAAKAGPAMLQRRRAAWDAAFTTLSHQLRNNTCDAFYYVSPQDTRKCSFVALFRAAGVGGCPEAHALISRSTAGLRALLAEEAVEFSMPMAPAMVPDAEAAAGLADVESSKIGKAVVKDALSEHDGTPLSMLAVVGETDVAGLVEVLSNQAARLYEATCDVPLLLAPTPFAGAHLTQLQPQVVFSSMSAKAGASRQRTGDKSNNFGVELEGLIPAWVTDRLTMMLTEAQGGTMQVSLESLPLSGCLNMPVADLRAAHSGLSADENEEPSADGVSARPVHWQRRGFVNEEEGKRWREQAIQSGQLVVSNLDVRDGKYKARVQAARSSGSSTSNMRGWQ